MPDLRRCESCNANYIPGPTGGKRLLTGEPPAGHRIAASLCHECARKLRARAHGLWGWVYLPIGVTIGRDET